MNSFNCTNRILADVSIENEWFYLVNETFIGEKMIVPSLQKIYKDKRLPKNLKTIMEDQINDEINHVVGFSKTLNRTNFPGSSYDQKLESYIDGIPNNTLKLFALQGMLEGVALGALKFRLENWCNSPSHSFDKEVEVDELRHVSLSFNHFNELQHAEGLVSKEDFDKVTKKVNEIFSDSFSSEVIEGVFNKLNKYD